MHRTPRHSTKPRARIQVLRCADEILKRRAQGESFTDIHVDLLERAEIDIRLRVFTLWVSRLEVDDLSNALPTDDLTRVNKNRGDARDAKRRPAIQQSVRTSESNPPQPSQEPRIARLGVPILPAPNSEPDCEALFGDKE